MSERVERTYFTVADSLFFPGLVALLNSLHLTGNAGRLVVLDLGLLPHQRQILEGHVEFCPRPQRIFDNPLLSKPFPHLLNPEGVIVIIDSDIIVTSSLDEMMSLAAAGHICMFSDETQDQRWFPEWGQAFGLRSPLRQESSQNSGFIALSAENWSWLLQRWWESCGKIPAACTRGRGASYSQPFWDGDQDALNALLMSEVPKGHLATWPQHVSYLLMDVEVTNRNTLECRHRGKPAYLLHQTGSPKPWSPEAWMRVERNAYVRLLPRLLFAPDIKVRLRPKDLPIWLRPSLAGTLSLWCLTLLNRTARRIVAKTSGSTHDRLMKLRARLVRSRKVYLRQ